MKGVKLVILLTIASARTVFSFAPSLSSSTAPKTTTMPFRISATNTVVLQASSPSASGGGDEKRMQEILAEEAMNSENLKATAEQMKSMTPQDMDAMISEMENMPASEKQQLEKLGMDPELMKTTMQMMKQNPEMLQSMGDMMGNMTPQELMEQSRLAQETFKQQQQQQQNNQAAATTATSSPADVQVADVVKDDAKTDDDDEEEDEIDDDEDDEPIEPDQAVLDAMYRVAEIMSTTEPSAAAANGVTFQGFVTIPPVAILSGTGEDDLSKTELQDCWNKGSLGSTRVDRAGFERVWREVQDNYYSDIVEEAQDRLPRSANRKKRGGTKPTAAAPVATPAPAATTTTTTPPPSTVVGASISPEQLQQQVKSMKDDDLNEMFDRMNNMTPQDEQRMRAMGVDPAMMKTSAEMMQSNPLLRKAATTMLKNAPPEQLIKASQKAQEKMANMSEEEKQRMLNNLK